MTTLALGENVTLARHPAMLRNVDALIGVFVRVGLPLPDAYRACMETIRTVAGFVEFQDAPHDRPPPSTPPTCTRRPRLGRPPPTARTSRTCAASPPSNPTHRTSWSS
ncbi:hypothetical protein [Actinomadura rifamycini]|uniref:hypothetical protein n=1 Tax=Actinomadura rifamycini TaxID=31962 RepID=UPI00040A151A|nr:hypothetical protein [Actinomadura rifamycini]